MWSESHADCWPQVPYGRVLWVGHEAPRRRPEVGCMRPASRGEDRYQKYVHPTHVRGEKTYTRAAKSPTSTHTQPLKSRAAKRTRRARRRRRRRERSARRPCACCRVARRPCRAGSRAGGTCEGPRGGRTTTRGRRRLAAAAAGVGEPRPLERAVTRQTSAATGAGGCVCEQGSRDAFSLSGAGTRALAGGQQAAREHRVERSVEATNEPRAGVHVRRRRRCGAAH